MVCDQIRAWRDYKICFKKKTVQVAKILKLKKKYFSKIWKDIKFRITDRKCNGANKH